MTKLKGQYSLQELLKLSMVQGMYLFTYTLLYEL
jgi:hypothetical protein